LSSASIAPRARAAHRRRCQRWRFGERGHRVRRGAGLVARRGPARSWDAALGGRSRLCRPCRGDQPPAPTTGSPRPSAPEASRRGDQVLVP